MNYFETLKYGSSKLRINKIISHSLDSEVLLANVLDSTREDILLNPNNKIKRSKFIKFKKFIFRRKKNEPIAQIINKKEFWKYNFFVNEHVLIPRPETELIVEEILNLTDINTSKRILDVGTGSGCIAISIFKERPKCYFTALDISKNALKVAKYNAKMHHLGNKIKFVNIDIDKIQDNKYDFIVSNPPYIKKFNLKRLEDNVKFFEPCIALDAGVDGYKEIKKLILKSKKLLKNNDKLIFEIGKNQEMTSKKLLVKNGFYVNNICKDINTIPRVIVATKI